MTAISPPRLAPLVLLLLLPGCGGGREDGRDIGRQAGDAISDTQALKEASAGANEVVRRADDCDALREVLPDTNRRLDAVAARVRTATGRSTLHALRQRVKSVAQVCP